MRSCHAVAMVIMLLMVAQGAGVQAGSEHAYTLGPNDVIRIQVFGEDDLSLEAKVGDDGKISFPLLGPVSTKGKTILQLRDFLTKRLADGYLKNPKVTILIAKYRNFYVAGEVKAPGGYAYEPGLTVQKAIAMAGGFTEKAARRHLELTRTRDGVRKTVAIDLHASALPDDLIVVSQAKKFYVTGEVRKPGEYVFEEGLTVHQVITMAGGLTEKAAERRTKILRMVDNQEQSFSARLDEPISPDDIILVPESFF